ncbi:hypothetical protein NEOLEDRAFT_1183825 [Neolentinus lepideus HHB14362 ss-1]|uniref:Tc1-like transposase DDE domain-containing protein n=1 Tax=Neolentinus lepideus HHB14362 ss-1 TaxID=1314782 RepID=A0A165MZ51_9AGAM|nr:hypothetical protein NEOLEDRAFT_1183825 [Neolentinus lepideus HHB14362 ss-1]
MTEEDDQKDAWCCMFWALSLQEDFLTEKCLIQQSLEQKGHICKFLPKFHCELNPIEMVWGYAKYRFRAAADGKLATGKALVPQCLDMADTLTI